MDQTPERIDGPRRVEILREWIHGRRLCKMGIPGTPYVWITMILGINLEEATPYLMVDQVKEGAKIIARHQSHGLRFEFLEKDGVLCWFETRAIQSRSSSILTELPEAIFRLQRRRYVRVNARSGTEIVFQRSNGSLVNAKVKDYGLGGVSFFTPPLTPLNVEELVSEVQLKIPFENRWKQFRIPISKVIRLERTAGGGGLCILEFIEIPETEKEQMWQSIFQEQRLQLRKTGKI